MSTYNGDDDRYLDGPLSRGPIPWEQAKAELADLMSQGGARLNYAVQQAASVRHGIPCCDEVCLGCGAGCWLLQGHKHDRGQNHECGVCYAGWEA